MASPHNRAHPVGEPQSIKGLPIAPAMAPATRTVGDGTGGPSADLRLLKIVVIALLVGVWAALIARLLTVAIALVTNLAFYGTLSVAEASPKGNSIGAWVILVPVAGAFLIGLMARYGSTAIRGHGIPEAMEQVLFNESRIPARVLLLKPLSAVVSIGTGGPFGAEGPIIATGGALGSLIGQLLPVSPDERKTLLAAGAAAGMAAIFGTPVAAVLLAMELLLFEYRPRSLIPVILATVAATGVRIGFDGMQPAFTVRDLPAPAPWALVGYIGVGAVAGIASVTITKAVYAVEDAFERLPVHWMWWPMLGAIPVGIIGLFVPATMGVGYDNIRQMISGNLTGTAVGVLCVCKLVSWLFALGSGTSGGTLAPLFTIGGGVGYATSSMLGAISPAMGIDLRVGTLVGMAALFAGAARAPLACVVFAFEATRQPMSLLPLLGGCGAAYFLSCLMMRTSIMTEKIARRGRVIPAEYTADHLEKVLVRDVGIRPLITLKSTETIASVQSWLRSGAPGTMHQGFPIVDDFGQVLGMVTQRDIHASRSAAQPVISLVTRGLIGIHPSASLREAADTMLREGIGRLPVIEDGRMTGMVTRSDLVEGHTHRLAAAERPDGMRRWDLHW